MRLVVKTYKYKLYNSKKNRYLVRQIELASEIWNFCIAMRRMYYLVYGKTLKANDLKMYIAKIYKRRKWVTGIILAAKLFRMWWSALTAPIKPILIIRKRRILPRSRCQNLRSARCIKVSRSNRQAISLTAKAALPSMAKGIGILILGH